MTAMVITCIFFPVTEFFSHGVPPPRSRSPPALFNTPPPHTISHQTSTFPTSLRRGPAALQVCKASGGWVESEVESDPTLDGCAFLRSRLPCTTNSRAEGRSVVVRARFQFFDFSIHSLLVSPIDSSHVLMRGSIDTPPSSSTDMMPCTCLWYPSYPSSGSSPFASFRNL